MYLLYKEFCVNKLTVSILAFLSCTLAFATNEVGLPKLGGSLPPAPGNLINELDLSSPRCLSPDPRGYLDGFKSQTLFPMTEEQFFEKYYKAIESDETVAIPSPEQEGDSRTAFMKVKLQTDHFYRVDQNGEPYAKDAVACFRTNYDVITNELSKSDRYVCYKYRVNLSFNVWLAISSDENGKAPHYLCKVSLKYSK